MKQDKKLVIIDGKSVFFRGYYAMPNLQASDGTSTSGVYGFAMMGLRILKEFKPDYVIVAWDKSKTNIRARRKLYPEYKAGRKPMPEDLRLQIPLLQQMLEALHWPLIELDDFEADDIMATLSAQARDQGLKTILVTSDLDILQAVNSHATVVVLKKGLTNVVNYDRPKFTEEYGMTPEQFIDYKALKGDSSDNVPGVAGVGDKTAKTLIQTYGTLKGVYEHLEEITPEGLKAKLTKDKDMAFLSHKLLEIRFDAPTKLDLKAADATKADLAAINELFNKLQFRRLFAELPPQLGIGIKDQGSGKNNSQIPNPKSPIRSISVLPLDQTAIKSLQAADKLVVYTDTEIDATTKLPKPVSMLLSPSPGIAYLASTLTPQLAELLTRPLLIGHNLKNDLKAWRQFSCQHLFDIMIAAFIIDPLFSMPSLPELASKYLGTSFEIVPPLDEIAAGQIASSLWQIYDHLSQKLKQTPSLAKLAAEMEFPIITVLATMEVSGVKLDTGYLKVMSKDITRRIEDIRSLVYKEAKEEFNISSPAQLAIVLFEHLQLPTTGIKKGKTGYSTAAGELDKLRGLHPVVNLISEYRELTKLKSTYVDTLPNLVDKASRLHTTFNQAVAQTGRLSSDNPNLQNIPIRTEVGRQIRQAFTANKGNVLISADYSQFELRLAAVLADDTNMIHAFNKGIDIHTMTAMEIYELDDIDMVTADQRRAAKTINFGVLYGLSPHGLSVATGMTREAAKKFIDRYFEARLPLLKYMEKTKDKAHKEGYVETLFGRRRPMPDIHSPNWVIRAAAERAAINMPIQGSAADITKLAMIKIDGKLDDPAFAGCKMLLQIHDSILVECPKPKAERVAKLLKDTMENIHKLPVKLDVDIKTGATWGDL